MRVESLYYAVDGASVYQTCPLRLKVWYWGPKVEYWILEKNKARTEKWVQCR
jgi:hypothetical protein